MYFPLLALGQGFYGESLKPRLLLLERKQLTEFAHCILQLKIFKSVLTCSLADVICYLLVLGFGLRISRQVFQAKVAVLQEITSYLSQHPVFLQLRVFYTMDKFPS